MLLRRVISALLLSSLALGQNAALAQSSSVKQSPTAAPRIISYNELIALQPHAREIYLKNIRQMLVELSFVKHSLDGRLVADNDTTEAIESLSKFTALLAAYETLVPSADAAGGGVINQCSAARGFGPNYNDVTWSSSGETTHLCHLQYEKCSDMSCEIEVESKCLENDGHVLVTYNSHWMNAVPRSVCVKKDDYDLKIGAHPKIAKEYDLRLSPGSATKFNRPADAVRPSERPVANDVGPAGAPNPAPAPGAATGPATSAAPAAKAATAPGASSETTVPDTAAPKGVAPSGPAEQGAPKQTEATAPQESPGFEASDKCLSRAGKNSAAYRVALGKYHQTSVNKCIYAGNLMTYGSKKDGETETPDIRASACQKKSSEKFGEATVKCENESQVLCNPLLFGIESAEGTNFVGRCVARGAGATVACEAKVSENVPVKRQRQAHNQRQQRHRRGQRRAASAQRVVEPAPEADEQEQPSPAGSTKATNFLLSKVSGISEAWNEFAKSITDLCGKKDELFAQVHCTECAVIAKRLTAANDAIKAPSAPAAPPAANNPAAAKTKQ